MNLIPQTGSDVLIAHSTSTDPQFGAEIAVLPDGTFMVAWSERVALGVLQDYFSIFSSTGDAILLDASLSNDSSDRRSVSDILAVEDRFLMVWRASGNGDYNYYATLFDTDGNVVTPKTHFASFDSGLRSISLWQNDDNRIVAGYSNWSSSFSGGSDDWDVAGALYELRGNTLVNVRSEVLLNASLPENQEGAQIAQLADGRHIAVWDSDNGNGVNSSVLYYRFLDSSLSPKGDQQLVAEPPSDSSMTVSNQVVALASGGFAVVWQQRDQAVEGYEDYWAVGDYFVYYRVFDADGVPMAEPVRISSGEVKDEFRPQMTKLADGNFLVTWNSHPLADDPWQINGQYFDQNFTPLGNGFELAQYRDGSPIYTEPKIEPLENGGFLLAWDDLSETATEDSQDTDVFVQIFGPTIVAPSDAILSRLPQETSTVLASSDNITLHIVDSNGNATQDYDEALIVNGDYLIDAEAVQLIRLYSAALGRTPDRGGFDYWDQQVEQQSLAEIAEGFYWSAEMQQQMDTDASGTVTDEEYIAHLYGNVLGRQPDEAGALFWLGRLADDVSKGLVLAEFVNGEEFIGQTQSLVGEFAAANTDLWVAS
ncbi:DUF4214 domain-containing protein [Marinobacterium arenosum]|uniref:DUF4214 domain-containing protein n=1 Tax=Marinobacterium arenosum TaxID=2862496 RepID=UPI001C97A77E|nr:DUF4214 domain-containing protein [Marinobacterium arenosum]MBY4676807.1 DUF4214 domain-containing protein [Marinobacterium arenosum]